MHIQLKSSWQEANQVLFAAQVPINYKCNGINESNGKTDWGSQ